MKRQLHNLTSVAAGSTDCPSSAHASRSRTLITRFALAAVLAAATLSMNSCATRAGTGAAAGAGTGAVLGGPPGALIGAGAGALGGTYLDETRPRR